MSSDLASAWRTNCAIHMMLLDAIPAQAMSAQYTPTTRTVAAQFAHAHNVRVYHLRKRAPQHLGKLAAFPRGAQPAKTELKKALRASGEAVTRLFEDASATGSVKSWPGPPATFLGYFISHEAHHRGLINVCLRIGGHKLSQEVTYGLWDGWRKLSRS